MSKLTPHQSTALKTSGHLALTANAGSGKTFVLARKYLDALINSNLDVSNIAAITFTEKAASELYLKISVLIDDKLSEIDNLPDKKKLEKIRRQLVSANISTIHSFCINILREYPVEAKLDARFIPIDENLSQELIELSVEEIIRSSFDDELVSEDLKYLIRIFGSKSRLQSQIVRLVQNRKNVFVVKEEIYSLDEKSISESFFSKFCNDFINLWKKKKNEIVKNITVVNTAVLESDSSNSIAIEVKSMLAKLSGENDDVVFILNLLNAIKEQAFTKNITLKKRGYLKKETIELLGNTISATEELMNEFSAFEIPANHSEIELELAKLGKTLLSFFDYVLSNYESKKRVEGYIDYEDILIHTRILLKNHNVKTALMEKYKSIMVDEFQDTNEIQYEIFLPILDYLKSGNLFIVGDEKQSIYKFRDAEIEIFNLTRRNIKNYTSDKNLLVLPDSFRMSPAICVFCNHIFNNLFSNPDENFGEVPATDLVCARVDDIKGHVELLICRPDADSEVDNDNALFSEAELIGRKILELTQNDKYTFKDIAILVRKRKYFSDLEKVFIDYKIPFSIIGGRGFYQRQTITDIYNYLTFLTDENNNAALVGLLRSPFFNISDSKIFELSLVKSKSYWRKLITLKDEKDFKKAFEILNQNITLGHSLSLPELINKIITDNNYLSIIASRNDSEQEIANINKLIGIARNFNSTGFRNIYDFLSFLNNSISNLADESQASISANNNAVQMMTIHQSKGLEFPVVFLFKTDEAGLSNSIKAGEVKIDKKYGLLTKVPLNQNVFDDYYTAPIITLYNYYEQKKNNAELKRLLYVALTRAKDKLYITAKIEKDSAPKKDSFLKLISEGLDGNILNHNLVIQEKLEFLSIIDENYVSTSRTIKIEIPITNEIELIKIENYGAEQPQTDYNLNVVPITSTEKGEIISASKVSIYSQCPLKYLLTYDYGFKELNANYHNYKNKKRNVSGSTLVEMDEELIEDRFDTIESVKTEYDSALYGKIFHKILEKSIKPAQLKDFLDDQIKNDNIASEISNKFYEKISLDLKNYTTSKTAELINSYPNNKNEFEIYVREKDYFLHGVIDKIIFDERQDNDL